MLFIVEPALGKLFAQHSHIVLSSMIIKMNILFLQNKYFIVGQHHCQKFRSRIFAVGVLGTIPPCMGSGGRFQPLGIEARVEPLRCSRTKVKILLLLK